MNDTPVLPLFQFLANFEIWPSVVLGSEKGCAMEEDIGPMVGSPGWICRIFAVSGDVKYLNIENNIVRYVSYAPASGRFTLYGDKLYF